MPGPIPCALLLAALLAGCGDDDVDCSFEACGGDPVGDWTIDGACAATTGGDGDCPGSTVTESVDYSGTWSFDDDMSYSVDGQALISRQGSFPRSCLGQIGECEDLAEEGLTCQTSGDRCECNSLRSEPFDLTGNWSVTGPTLLLDGSPWSFCQMGDSLKFQTSIDDTIFVLSR